MPTIYNKVTIDDTTLLDLSQDTVADASHIRQGYVGHLNDGSQVTGTYSGGGGSYAWLGEGAEKVGTVVNRTINLKNDTGYDDWEATTTATTIIAADTDPYYSLTADVDNYDYCFVTRGYIEPVYQNGTPTTYRTHRVCQYHVQYYAGSPSNSSIEQVQDDTVGSIVQSSSLSNGFIQVFYNSAGVLTARTATQCGPLYMSSIPSYSNTAVTDGTATISIKFPEFYARCDTNRFRTERKSQVDSANTNYLLTVDLYRVPHGNGIFSHWYSQMCADLNAE